MKKPHIMVIGLRGFPGVQGGVETHAENLFPEIAAHGYRVTAILRASYVSPDHPRAWKGVDFIRLWSPRSKSFEAILHTFLAVLYAGWHRPDILHIQAIGPAMLTPLARLLGLKIVVTHHGADYDRQKWGKLAKNMLRLGENFGVRFAHRRIAISRTMQRHVHNTYDRETHYIPNGVTLPAIPQSRKALDRFGLEPQRYILLVSRLVPEKRHLDLIRAFAKAGLPGWKLVLVGDTAHTDDYSRQVEALATTTPHVVMTGFQTGRDLQELYAHAGLFVLPSSHEGLPIALLEALSYGLPTLVSDIEPHREIGLPPEHYFRMGDSDDLVAGIKRMAAKPIMGTWRETTRAWVAARYSWADAAAKTTMVYASLLNKRASS